MITSLRSEWRKLMTTKIWWGMLLGAIALTSIGTIAQIARAGSAQDPHGSLVLGVTQRSIAGSPSTAYLFALVVGIIIITTEFRHFTSRPTFLIEPHRGLVIISKLIVAAALGLVYGLVCVATAIAIMVPWFSIKHIAIGWSSNHLYVVFLGSILVIIVFAIIGVSVGAIFRNQIAAILGALGYLFVLEPLISIIPLAKTIYPYLPGIAAQSLSSYNPQAASGLLNQWQGGLVLLAWGVLFALAGWLITKYRDIL